MPPDLAPLLVPRFPRAADYADVWAIEQRAGQALWELAQRTDLAAHVQALDSPPLRSEIMRQPLPDGRHIAVLAATGTLMKQRASMSSSTSTVQLRRDVRSAANNPEVAAILLAIDSPGGTVAGIGDLADDVKAAAGKKPVWAQIEDLGASAAYWLASQAGRVFANHPTALVGSIGTFLTVYDMSRMAANEGVEALVFATGPLKGAGVPGTEITAEQRAYYQRIVDQAQVEFDRAVMAGRDFTEAHLSTVRTGEVFSATEALRLRLIDGIQSMEQTLLALAKEAGKPGSKGAKMEENEVVGGGGTARAGSAPPPPTMTVSVDVQADVQALRGQLAAEHRRVADIAAVCGRNHPDIQAQAIADGWDRTRTELEVLRRERPAPGVISRSHDRDCTRDALQAAMLLRHGVALDHSVYQSRQALSLLPSWLRQNVNAETRQRAMEAAHRYQDMSAVDICREAIRLDGRDAPHARSEMIQAAVSGSALTNIFTTNVNTVLLMAFMSTDDTTRGWTSETDVSDFKTNERPRVQVGNGLAKLPRGGTADHASYTDHAESYRIARYANQFVVDEQDIIDDSLGALSDIPRRFGEAAGWLRPDLVYAHVMLNPTLSQNSLALFHATNGNLNTSSALTAVTLRAAVSDMRLFRENSRNLNIQPTHLIVPPTLEFLGYELIASANIQVQWGADDETTLERGTLNAIQRLGLQLVSEARLENGVTDPSSGTAQSGSASTWYIASTMVPTVEVAYLRGTGRAPQVRSFVLTQGQWGIGWDVNMDIGCKALEWRGMHKNTA